TRPPCWRAQIVYTESAENLSKTVRSKGSNPCLHKSFTLPWPSVMVRLTSTTSIRLSHQSPNCTGHFAQRQRDKIKVAWFSHTETSHSPTETNFRLVWDFP
ncbi:hypothetical protein RRG08_017686, partial [Elysia crispata]